MTRRRGPYKHRPAEGTVAALWQAYQQSPRYRRWSPATREQHDRRLHRFAVLNGSAMVHEISRGDIIRLRDQLADSPGAANNWLKSLKGMFDYAVDLEWIAINPVASVPRFPPVSDEGHRAWREDEIEQYFRFHKLGSTAHAVATLMLTTGAADVDVVKLGWQNIAGDRFIYRRSKMSGRGGVEINIPILPALSELLGSLPQDRLTFLETRYGRPKSAKALPGNMADWTRQAMLEPGCTPHGLRKVLARRLAEAGATPQTIMSWLGHRSISQAMHYSQAYDRARAADAGAELMANISPAKGPVIRLKKP